jgi:isopenicillin-N N-acyltransferase-like protein
MTSPFPRPDQRLQIVVDAADPFERGADRGRQLRDTLSGTIDAYDRLFRGGGIDERTVRDDAERLLDAIGAHRPALRTQIEGIASGADAELWRVAALNGRTEILSRSVAVPPGECSTIVRSVRDAGGRAHALGVQTWDWHMEIAPYWHTVVSRGGAQDYAGRRAALQHPRAPVRPARGHPDARARGARARGGDQRRARRRPGAHGARDQLRLLRAVRRGR